MLLISIGEKVMTIKASKWGSRGVFLMGNPLRILNLHPYFLKIKDLLLLISTPILMSMSRKNSAMRMRVGGRGGGTRRGGA